MERFVIEFSKELIKQKHNVTIFTSNLKEHLNIKNVKIIRNKIFIPRYFNKVIKYLQLSWISKKHLKNNKYDVVVAMGHSGIFLKDYVWRASGSPIPYNKKIKKYTYDNLLQKILVELDLWTQKIIEKKAIKNAKSHMFPSEQLKKLFENSYHFKSKKYFIPCSGIGITKKRHKKKLIDWKKYNKTYKILTVRGISEKRKGRDIIISTFEKIEDKNIKLFVCGNYNKKLTKNIQKKIIDLGPVPYDRMFEVYENVDLLIFPSLYEGFPNVLLEAICFDLPIISSKLIGINEYSKLIKNIKILKTNNSKTLIKEIIKFKNKKKKNNLVIKLDYQKFTKKFIKFIKNEKNVNLLKE